MFDKAINDLLATAFNQFRRSAGLEPDNMSDKAKEYFSKAMIEYSNLRLQSFCEYLNKNNSLGDSRFDAMMEEFKKHH